MPSVSVKLPFTRKIKVSTRRSRKVSKLMCEETLDMSQCFFLWLGQLLPAGYSGYSKKGQCNFTPVICYSVFGRSSPHWNWLIQPNHNQVGGFKISKFAMSSDRAASQGQRNPKVAVTHMLSEGNYFKSAGQITYSVGFVNLPKCDLPKKKERKKKKTLL